ncbi:MAG: AMP-binding protein, partial [bacterium]|nr:AMP-binding protein [bacterium]
FFLLGGHSLKATVMVSRLHKELEVVVPLAEVFKTPTIRALAQFIKHSLKKEFVSIEPVEKKEYYPLSSEQKRMYILQQMEINGTVYNMPETIPLNEAPDIEKLEKTFTQLIRRHESLRTSFHMMMENPIQRIHDNVDFAITYYDLTEGNPGTEAANTRKDTYIRPFDLSRAPLLRVGAVKSENNRYLLFVDMHHIISDGVSHQVLLKDFTALYAGKNLEPLRIQYKDFSQWQYNGKEKGNLKQQEAYWLREFQGEIPVLNMPADYPRPSIQSFEGDTVNFQLDKKVTAAIKKLALEEGATLYMVLLGLCNIFLAKISGMEDVVLGTPLAGRIHADLQQGIGMCVSTPELRNRPNGNKSFLKFLHEVKIRTLEAIENKDYPFEDLVVTLDVKREPGHNPLFDVMFAFVEADGESPVPIPREENRSKNITSKFDLTLDVSLSPSGLLFCSFEYCSKLFKPTTIRRFISFFKNIVSTAVCRPGGTIGEIEIISPLEKQQVLEVFNRTDTPYPAGKTFSRQFEEQAANSPGKIALVFKQEQITYRELNHRANRLARFLRKQGVGAGTIVPIMTKRSADMIIAVSAVLKAGGAYLPLDADYPVDRLRYMMENSGADILLTQKDTQSTKNDLTQKRTDDDETPSLTFFNGNVIRLDDPRIAEEPDNNLEQLNTPQDPAYVIYTSGSTG